MQGCSGAEGCLRGGGGVGGDKATRPRVGEGAGCCTRDVDGVWGSSQLDGVAAHWQDPPSAPMPMSSRRRSGGALTRVGMYQPVPLPRRGRTWLNFLSIDVVDLGALLRRHSSSSA